MHEQAQPLAGTFTANAWLLGRLTEGVKESESLLSPSDNINCMNWVLGHIISGRHKALALLGVDGFWDESRLKMYRTGSSMIHDAEHAVRFNELLQELERSQSTLDEALQSASAASLAAVRETDRGRKPVREHVEGLGWHETFHVGQVDVLKAFVEHTRGERV